jgi:hypothetical protein
LLAFRENGQRIGGLGFLAERGHRQQDYQNQHS